MVCKWVESKIGIFKGCIIVKRNLIWGNNDIFCFMFWGTKQHYLFCWMTCTMSFMYFQNFLKFREGKEEPSPLVTSLSFKVECLVWPFPRISLHSWMFLSILVLPLLASHLLFLQPFIFEEHHTIAPRRQDKPQQRLIMLTFCGFFHFLEWKG